MSDSGNSSEPQPDISFFSLAGSLIFALAINWGLQGILFLQVYTYYLAFPHDRIQAKLQVYGVLIFECLQSAIVAHDVVIAFTSSLGGFHASKNLHELNSLHTHWFSIPVAGGITGGVGQLFFAYRIWKISSEKGPPFAISVLAIASIGAALGSASAFFDAKTFTSILGANTGFAAITSWNGIGAICDIVIALSMPYFLMRHGTGLPATHVFIVKLVLLLIQTGGLTAIMAILHLCLFVSRNPLFVIPGLAMSKIYATTMLVIFNNRIKFLGGRFDREEEEETALTDSSRERRNSGTKILVSNGRLTFQLANIPPSPTSPRDSENPPSSSSVSGVGHGPMN